MALGCLPWPFKPLALNDLASRRLALSRLWTKSSFYNFENPKRGSLACEPRRDQGRLVVSLTSGFLLRQRPAQPLSGLRCLGRPLQLSAPAFPEAWSNNSINQ